MGFIEKIISRADEYVFDFCWSLCRDGSAAHACAIRFY